MKLNRFLIIYAVVTFSWGIAWLLLPSQLFTVYRLQETASLQYAGQLLGAILTGLAMIAWSIRSAPRSEVLRSILGAFFAAEALCFIVSLTGQLRGTVNIMGWSTVIICFVFTIGFGYFYVYQLKWSKCNRK